MVSQLRLFSFHYIKLVQLSKENTLKRRLTPCHIHLNRFCSFSFNLVNDKLTTCYHTQFHHVSLSLQRTKIRPNQCSEKGWLAWSREGSEYNAVNTVASMPVRIIYGSIKRMCSEVCPGQHSAIKNPRKYSKVINSSTEKNQPYYLFDLSVIQGLSRVEEE